MAKLITKSDFARVAGCSPATVTRAAKTTLAPAMVADRIDAEHPAARLFIERQRARKR